jgi:hypothetical protein
MPGFSSSEGNLSEDSAGFAGGIGGARDWAPNHDVSRARGDGLGWRDHPGLVTMFRARWTHPWGHDGKVAFEFTAQCGGFLGGGDYAVASVGDSERRQT